MTSSTDILNAALAYAQRGWSVIPIWPGTKRAAGKWRDYQKRRPNRTELDSWFGNGGDFGLAVVLGKVSGGLVCRDFDDKAGYETWAAMFADLAKALPTVATARGRHVYFRAQLLRSLKLPDGEYRANGNYVLLPPSRHPSGELYTWLISPPEGPVPLVNPLTSGLLPPTPAEGSTQPRQKDATPVKAGLQRLTQRTQRFLNIGAVEGHRNRELFCAACDLAACGIPRSEAERKLLDACARCQPPYPPEEAVPTIASAYSRPRQAAKGGDDPRACYMIPRCIAQWKDITAADKLLWGALDYRQRDKAVCYPSISTLAKDAGTNRDTAANGIRRLERAGLLTVHRVRGRVNQYTTHLSEIPTGQTPADHKRPVGESDTKRHDSDDVGTKDAEKPQDIHAEHPDGQTAPDRSVAT